MLRRGACRGTCSKLIWILLIAVASSLFIVNFLGMMSSLPIGAVSSYSVVDDPAIFPLLNSAANQSRPVAHQISASFVRIEVPDSAGESESGQVRVVLSLDASELADFMEAYKRGFVPEKTHYPEDGGILLHNMNLCRTGITGQLDWIVFVHTAPENADRRQMLRETWANLALFKTLTFRVVFLIGIPPVDKQSLQADIKAEFMKYGDIVQGNFADSYKNMTHKAVLGLRWLSEYCPQAQYALKADDDTFLNIFEMVRLMLENANKPHVLICPLWYDNAMPILRDPKTCMKWCVKSSELRGRTHFPQYCAGIGYIISRRLAPLLYNASRSTPFFWIDDVYVTGLLPKKLDAKIDYVSTIERFTAKQDLAVENYESTEELKYFYVHAKDKEIFMRLWKALLKRLTTEQKNMINSGVLAI